MDNIELLESEAVTHAIDELKNVSLSLLKEVSNYLSKKDFTNTVSRDGQEAWIKFYGTLATDCGQIVLMDSMKSIPPNDRKIFFDAFRTNMRDNMAKFNKMREAE